MKRVVPKSPRISVFAQANPKATIGGEISSLSSSSLKDPSKNNNLTITAGSIFRADLLLIQLQLPHPEDKEWNNSPLCIIEKSPITHTRSGCSVSMGQRKYQEDRIVVIDNFRHSFDQYIELLREYRSLLRTKVKKVKQTSPFFTRDSKSHEYEDVCLESLEEYKQEKAEEKVEEKKEGTEEGSEEGTEEETEGQESNGELPTTTRAQGVLPEFPSLKKLAADIDYKATPKLSSSFLPKAVIRQQNKDKSGSWRKFKDPTPRSVFTGDGIFLEQSKEDLLLERLQSALHRSYNHPIGYYAVFDGHSGARCSTFSQIHLLANLLSNRHFLETGEIDKAFLLAFLETDAQWLLLARSKGMKDGTTAVVVIVIGTYFAVAHVGDSRALLVTKAGKPLRLTTDHKPENRDEELRIVCSGGYVQHNFHGKINQSRVNGILAMSRSLGDIVLKEPSMVVIARPDITVKKITPDMTHLIIASDGLWDVLTDQAAADICKKAASPEDAAEALVNKALKKDTKDNTSVVVVQLNPPPANDYKPKMEFSMPTPLEELLPDSITEECLTKRAKPTKTKSAAQMSKPSQSMPSSPTVIATKRKKKVPKGGNHAMANFADFGF